MNRIRIKAKNNKGLTLIELLVALAVLSILSVSLYSVFDSTTKVIRQGNASTTVFQNARSALDIMTRDISSAFISAADSVYSMKFSGTSQVDFTCLLRAGALYEVGYLLSGDTVWRREAWPDGDVSADNGLTIDAAWPLAAMAFDVKSLTFEYIKSAGGDLKKSTDVGETDPKIFAANSPSDPSDPVLPYAVRITLVTCSEETTKGNPVIDDKTFQTIVYPSVK